MQANEMKENTCRMMTAATVTAAQNRLEVRGYRLEVIG